MIKEFKPLTKVVKNAEKKKKRGALNIPEEQVL